MALPRRPPTLTRVYLDGPFGIGKTSILNAMPDHTPDGAPILKVYEPMKYWRCQSTDLVVAANETPERRRGGALSRFQSDMIMASIQARFADPYLLFHERLSSKCRGKIEICDTPAIILMLDRHPVAAILCFPITRYLLGEYSLEMLISSIIRLPLESPGCNLTVTILPDEKEHVNRICSRDRPGETADRNMLRTLNAVYASLVDTVKYANLTCPYEKESWEMEWLGLPWFEESLLEEFISRPRPVICSRTRMPLDRTLLAIFKRKELCSENGELLTQYSWILWGLLTKLHTINVELFDISGMSRRECASAIMHTMPERLSTLASWNDLCELEDDVISYNKGMCNEVGASR
ncbi:UL23 thymidine kinase [Meleagrid alphaherpesvirus 1]|uniref:Thymidine kinase n=3 Tax=Meleagrid herpesvirus 1 TaxID=37108 RepID=KITH_MEHV1|nr:thymidine kinase [Meleagrid alphaherpesvirus 1]P25987.1 RecName: Full=Thymidine kinase [Meleagrid alphaherpesvirus 1]pir/KIBEFC/ thymidine kinase (EC 2.7.1.21) - turkey herpesvirus (strain Fc-126) [Meleagrid alphaherpesvirus 1]AKQ48620.1 thymidine kinase [iBAC vector pMeHV1-C7]AKQ48692.1 thymidine kinase [iBAC vector pMeHV1-C9]AKQ48764.1 thymidine kinase [iBAC vector pMeHV1-C10]AKQ48836.1 thymidine kinase [iBAC vector pMeHV1-C17]AKQ48909.1 thymidine kinase [iBAC vector pMeHV1-C18]